MSEPENRLGFDMATKLLRLTMLRRASEIIGQAELADALSIGPRALRAKLSVDRGVTDDDLRLTAKALEAHAASALRLANTIGERAAFATSHLQTRSN